MQALSPWMVRMGASVLMAQVYRWVCVCCMRLWILTINPYMVDNYIYIVIYTMYVIVSPYLHCTFPR